MPADQAIHGIDPQSHRPDPLPRDAASRVEILECTLRDGSYAVDFKFTERDTALLAGTLAKLGFKWIEVGHGLGLGAARAGKGSMPASDERLIESAKQATTAASPSTSPSPKIGAFFIPGIGAADDLNRARAAGLDFVRIGCSASEIEQSYPYLELARKLGLVPCLNFMKTYGITPAEFAEKAKAGESAGAEVIYCVDSAGSMFPEDIGRYLSAARAVCECALGFHGHSNLQFAVANSVEAFRCGATMIDATLYGLGRSSGNVPTEVAVAVFDNLGIETGINLFEVMDAADQFLSPLMSQMQLYDMMSVAMGYSRFHSSFLPKVAAAAKAHSVDSRRLVAAMGKLNPLEVNESDLERIARSLPKAANTARDPALISFCAAGISEHAISSSIQAVRALVEGMSVTCAKRRAKPVLELVPSESADSDPALAGMVLADLVLTGSVPSGDATVIGRVTYGSRELLEQVLDITRDTIALYLFDLDGGRWAADHMRVIRKSIGDGRVMPIRSRRLRAAFEEEILLNIAQRYGDACLLVYGNPSSESLVCYSQIFRSVAVRGSLPCNAPANAWEISDFSDRMHLDLGVTAALFLCPPSAADAAAIDQFTSSDAVLITTGYFPRLQQGLPDRNILRVDPCQAYHGQVARWTAISNMMTLDRQAKMAVAE
jgi:4-hydroxy-2-oxovalerate aldolase